MDRKRGGPEMSRRDHPEENPGGADRRKDRKANTEEQNRETSGIPGRRAVRSRHPHSPDPGMKTDGPGEHTPRTRHASGEAWTSQVGPRRLWTISFSPKPC
ncbi:hypothetical protein NDU88_002376 [Pleurodeles waltl]|uniref:Uncharacterized protein n=1 Tax=Pleurodeles waltl TaxID=8319 RepID=A0AAV7REB5_PLEWA|nr:hypothetical protein NDU88_002376 [Pleurodeles waltl]